MKKIKISNAFFLTIIMLIAFACNSSNTFKIEGKTDDNEMNGSLVYLMQITESSPVAIDSTIVVDNYFSFEGALCNPKLHLIFCKKSGKNLFFPFVLEKGKILMDISDKPLLSGTRNNDSLQQYLEVSRLYERQFAEIIEKWQTATTDQNKQQLVQQYSELEQELLEKSKTFVSNNIQNAAGAYVFIQIFNLLNSEEQMQIIQNAASEFLAQPSINRLVSQVEAMKKVAVGRMFVDVEMMTPNGNKAKLSDYVGRGRYTVVDFWASWCGPCRAAMPQLKKIYEKYNAQVQFVGVSLDSNQKDWVASIEKLDLPWPHMSDLKGWDSAANSVYGVTSIPHLILFDKEGIILARDLNDETLQTELEKIFHKNIHE